ncbi:MAG: hypothetical protein ABSG76_17410 [Xanthobacteraceae bacterium]
MRAGVDARASAWGAVASATGAVGLGFLLIGLFIWLDSRYDVVTAWLVVGLLLILIALALTLMLVLVRRRPAPVAELRVAPAGPWWLEPRMLGSALQVIRVVGARRTSLLLVAALACGFLLSSTRATSRMRPPH